MLHTNHEQRRRVEGLERAELARRQLYRLNALLSEILPRNRFYAEKLAGLALPLPSLDRLSSLPLTVKDELEPVPPRDLSANLTYPLEKYVRFHRTSGTRGKPLTVLDTADDWQWWIDTWQFVLDAAQVTPSDRVVMASSYGPFIGFWAAHDALVARGSMVIPSGGFSTVARLELLRTSRATMLCCTPSYALRMAEVAAAERFDLAALRLRTMIVMGEPGGSVPAIRSRLETAWQTRVVDHAGATEVGPWGYADAARQGLHVVESEFLAEFLAVGTDQPAGVGELAELVLTSLGRRGFPVIRYRTGDVVRPTWNAYGCNHFVLLQGGVVGRADDMLVIRGINIYPSSVEQILRGFPEIAEYRLLAQKAGALDTLAVEIEDPLNQPERVARALQLQLGLKVEVRTVPLGSLPRFEGKAHRFVDHRGAPPR